MTIDEAIVFALKQGEIFGGEMGEFIYNVEHWLEELKELRRWKDDVVNSFCKFDVNSVEEVYNKGRADAIDIDMDKPMHFTDEQKAWVKNYIIINSKRQRVDTIDECLRIITECVWKDADMLESMIKELKHGNTGDN